MTAYKPFLTHLLLEPSVLLRVKNFKKSKSLGERYIHFFSASSFPLSFFLVPTAHVSHGLNASLLRLPPPFDSRRRSPSYLRPRRPQPTPSSLYSSRMEARAAQLRLCADGGANRLYDEMPGLLADEDGNDVRNRYKPDAVKGDMDSVRTEVLEFYSNLGTKIVDESHDQDTTDLHKCIAFIRDFTPDLDKSNLCILVAGALGGRFDHEVGNINVLYRFSTMRIILLSDDCLIHLLPRTHHHEIHIQSSVEGPHCGLVPIGTPSGSTTTTGLQWDLNDTEMKFGGLVSTSNIVKGDKITVQSDSDLLWTISIKKV